MDNLPLIIDIVVIAAVIGTAAIGMKKGFVDAALGFVPILAAIIGVKLFTPFAGKLLRQTPMFSSLSDSIRDTMHLDEMMADAAMSTQNQLIQNMKLPDFLKDSLVENNNPVIYNLLDVESIQEYISGFLANICINALSVILVFAVVFIAARLLLKALNLVSRLPVLNMFNRVCGFFIGGARGVFFLWVVGTVLTFLQCSGKLTTFFEALAETHAALFLYENNILLYFILTIFT